MIDDYAQDFKEGLELTDYIKISAKTGENINMPFDMISSYLLEKNNIKKHD